MKTPNLRTFYFIRHGETDWNKQRIYQGHNDIPLNDTGQSQALLRSTHPSSAKILMHVDAIFSSPLIRAHETAKIIIDPYPCKNIILVPDFMECKSAESAKFILNAKGKKDFPSFERLGASDETAQNFLERIENGLSTVMQSAAQTPLIVAHGGVGTAFSLILQTHIPDTPNCCLLEFSYSQEKYQLRTI